MLQTMTRVIADCHINAWQVYGLGHIAKSMVESILIMRNDREYDKEDY